MKKKWPECKNKKIALFLSRLNPIKCLENLIDAWSELLTTDGISDWLLLVGGCGEERYVNELKLRVEKAGLAGCIKFVGSVFGEKKVALMKAADLFVLPTKNENFGIVIAEALACSRCLLLLLKGRRGRNWLGETCSVSGKPLVVNGV